MSTAYYYFAASLPMLDFDSKPPVALTDFLDDTNRLLSPEDHRDIMIAVGQRTSRPRNLTLKKWMAFDQGLRNEMVVSRARKAGRDPLDHMRGERNTETHITDIIKSAQKAGTPLEAQRIIDKNRWDKLEELAAGHHFDFDHIVCYAVKLQLLDIYQQIGSDEGRNVFEKHREAVLRMDLGQLSQK